MHDKHTRTIFKTISWRALATFTTMVATYIVTGEYTTALAVGGIEATAKLVLYYVHERAWNRVAWGRVHRS